MSLGAVNPADGFAMALVVILVLSFSVVALLVACIKRSGKRAETAVEKLLEELRREEDEEKHPAPPSGTGEDREPWEREEDWWKKG
jgi:hypothetical protein